MSQIMIQDLGFTYEGDYTPVFEGLDLQLDTHWRLGLVGRNGRGKTTLLRLLEGELEGVGQIILPGRCRRYPKPVLHMDLPTRQVLLDGMEDVDEWRLIREFSRLGLGEDLLDRPFHSLSGGEQTRAALAAIFLDEDSYPMLDEPTNHLDVQGRELVAAYLKNTRRGFLLVSHDRAFLDHCIDHVLALNQTGPELMRGDFSTWFQEKEARDRGEQERNEKLKRDIRRLEQAARRASDWSERTEQSKFNSKNSGPRVDRGFIGHKSAKMMKRAKTLEARQWSAIQEKSALLRDVECADSLKLTPLDYHSERILELRNFAVCYEESPACKGVSFTLKRGDRICLDGGNGSGKTSLLRAVLGENLSHIGTLWRASGLKISYVSQKTDHLKGSPLEWAERQGIDLTRFFTVLRKLDFSRALFERDMSGYSEGQKKKVLLAVSLCQSAHLYIWDEPLNYIDLFSRIQIEDLLLDFQPTLLFVEHDQMFRQKIATNTVKLRSDC